MKSYSSYQKTRIAYHKDAKKNTVHRSSLVVPRFEQAETNISFVNHFLIKRNIQEVSLKVTAVNKNGEIIDSITYEIDKPIVYSLFLDEKNHYSVLKDADALLLITEWKSYRSPNFLKVKEMMKYPVIFDGRNQYDPKFMKKNGFEYKGIGR